VLERFKIEPVGERAETARRRSITISPSRGCEVLLRERSERERSEGAASERGQAPSASAERMAVAAG
jgi:hypothetical protein